MDNPFDRFDLDPREGVQAITARLKELAEDAPDEAARQRIREAWEELTLHPARRMRAALFAAPETRPALGAPPPRTRVRTAEVELPEIAPKPSVAVALGTVATLRRIDEPLAFDEDPLLDDG